MSQANILRQHEMALLDILILIKIEHSELETLQNQIRELETRESGSIGAAIAGVTSPVSPAVQAALSRHGDNLRRRHAALGGLREQLQLRMERYRAALEAAQ